MVGGVGVGGAGGVFWVLGAVLTAWYGSGVEETLDMLICFCFLLFCLTLRSCSCDYALHIG